MSLPHREGGERVGGRVAPSQRSCGRRIITGCPPYASAFFRNGGSEHFSALEPPLRSSCLRPSHHLGRSDRVDVLQLLPKDIWKIIIQLALFHAPTTVLPPWSATCRLFRRKCRKFCGLQLQPQSIARYFEAAIGYPQCLADEDTARHALVKLLMLRAYETCWHVLWQHASWIELDVSDAFQNLFVRAWTITYRYVSLQRRQEFYTSLFRKQAFEKPTKINLCKRGALYRFARTFLSLEQLFPDQVCVHWEEDGTCSLRVSVPRPSAELSALPSLGRKYTYRYTSGELVQAGDVVLYKEQEYQVLRGSGGANRDNPQIVVLQIENGRRRYPCVASVAFVRRASGAKGTL